MLKTLEEPPEYATIILTTANEAKLLNTIKSRCMKVSFKEISEKELQKKVEEILNVVPEKELISKSQGSLGRAIQMHEQKELYFQVDQVLRNLEKEDIIENLNNSEILYKSKENIREILDYIEVYLYNTKEIQKLNCIQYVEETKKRIIANSNYDMCIDYLLLNMLREINA